MTVRGGWDAKLVGFAGAALVAMCNVGCAPEIAGQASFPVLSRAALPNYYEPIKQVDEKRCGHVVLFFWAWGDTPNHEALVTDILEKHNGDAIADAELTFFSIPAFVYYQSCARIRGTVVRRSGAPGAATPAATPAAAAPFTPRQVFAKATSSEVAR